MTTQKNDDDDSLTDGEFAIIDREAFVQELSSSTELFKVEHQMSITID